MQPRYGRVESCVSLHSHQGCLSLQNLRGEFVSFNRGFSVAKVTVFRLGMATCVLAA